MKKARKLRFFWIVGLLTVVLFLAGISFMQAQVWTQDKPENPPGKDKKKPEEEATWVVELPDETTESMLYGDEGQYENNDSDVIVKMERMESKVRGKIYYTYFFCFKLVNLNLSDRRYAVFQGVGLYNPNRPSTSVPCCFFPGECVPVAPTCMDCFLNQAHPGAESDYFYLKFWVSEHSLLGYTLEEMEEEVLYPLSLGNNGIKFRIQNTEDFIGLENEYHNIDSEKHTYGSYGLNASIERTAGNRWRIHFENQELLVQETVTIRKHPARPIVENIVPLETTGNFTFWIEFIKLMEDQ